MMHFIFILQVDLVGNWLLYSIGYRIGFRNTPGNTPGHKVTEILKNSVDIKVKAWVFLHYWIG